MRLWTLHPRYLDRLGLLGGWREALLAQRVLRGETPYYRRHPQVTRFLETPLPLAYIAAYLEGLAEEGERRGYHFDRSRIRYAGLEVEARPGRLLGRLPPLPLGDGQLRYELKHLQRKLALRDPARLAELEQVVDPLPHPLYVVLPGPIAHWERPKDPEKL